MHYTHQGQALRSPSEHAAEVALDGSRVTVALRSGERLEWRYHDPVRLRELLGLFSRSRVVYPAFHALRVGPYWFNCANATFTPCPLTEGADAGR